MGAHPHGWVSYTPKALRIRTLTKLSRLAILPDTPRWYIKMDRYEDAAKSLGKLRRLPLDHPAIVEELNEVQANHAYEMSLGKASYIECFKGTLGKRLATGCLLQALQQLTGVNFICRCREMKLDLKGAVLTIDSLLRNSVFRERWFHGPIRYPDHHQRCQRRFHVPWSIHG
jgi:hypothetical protein